MFSGEGIRTHDEYNKDQVKGLPYVHYCQTWRDGEEAVLKAIQNQELIAYMKDGVKYCASRELIRGNEDIQQIGVKAFKDAFKSSIAKHIITTSKYRNQANRNRILPCKSIQNGNVHGWYIPFKSVSMHALPIKLIPHHMNTCSCGKV